MQAVIRHAHPEDVSRIAALHVTAWHETYRGLVPEPVIDAQTQATREALWRERLVTPPPDSRVLLAEQAGGATLLAFGACGRQRDPALPYPGEFHALYVLRRAQRAGLGRALMRAMATEMLDRGLEAASLWVLRCNLAARAFYIELGAKVAATRDNPSLQVAEVAFVWPDLRLLAAPRTD